MCEKCKCAEDIFPTEYLSGVKNKPNPFIGNVHPSNCTCVGHHAGSELTTESNIIVIGDDIRDIHNPPEGTVILNGSNTYTIYIGPTIGGKRNELYYFLKKENRDGSKD